MKKKAACQIDQEKLLKRISKRFSMQPVTNNRFDELCSFFKNAYADQPVAHAFQDPTLIKKRCNWLNKTYPLLSENEATAWICLKENQIVGHFAVLPAFLIHEDQKIQIYWGRDLIVSPEARTGGVGPFLILSITNLVKHPFFIAGLNERVYPIFSKLGFLDLGRIPLHIKIYQPARFLNAFPWPSIIRRIGSHFISMIQKIPQRHKHKKSNLSFVFLNQFDKHFDQWWQTMEKLFPFIIRRTSEIMNWRYRDHPSHRYIIIAAMESSSKLRGVAIVRHGRSNGLPAGFITELLVYPHDQETFHDLVAYTEEYLLRTAPEPLTFIRCTMFHPTYEDLLRKNGFLRVPSTIHWMVTHIQPGSSSENGSFRRQGWFLNGGDSDLDGI